LNFKHKPLNIQP